MALCLVCQTLDLRTLLIKSLKTRDEDGYHRPLDKEIQHHESLFSLRAAYHDGCPLCSLIWRALIDLFKKENGNLPSTDRTLFPKYNGPIAFSLDGWVETGLFRPGIPVWAVPNTMICRIEIYVPRTQMPPDIPELLDLLMREVHADSGSPSCLRMCKEWLSNCQQKHPHCPSVSRRHEVLPARLIDVSEESGNPRLVDTEDDTAQWAALSYCWGGDSKFKLTKETSKQLRQGCPVADFPSTLRDAIKVTRALGLKYLWIDSLCIFQGSDQESEDDWACEAAKMGDIYKGSTVTIAAAKAASVSEGFLGSRNRGASCMLPWRLKTLEGDEGDQSKGFSKAENTMPNETKVYLRLQEARFAAEEPALDCRWLSRGWTMQESLVPSRMLSFNEHQIVWDCTSGKVDENGRIRLRPSAFDVMDPYPVASGDFHRYKAVLAYASSLFGQIQHPEQQPSSEWLSISKLDLELSKLPLKLSELWCSLVLNFSKRSLTKCADVLPAICSLARDIHRVLLRPDTYYTGLWEADLKRLGLLWYSTEWGVERPSHYIAPSWSWASAISSPIHFWPERPGMVILFLVKEVEVKLRNAVNPFGQVTSGRLVIEAPFYRLFTLKNDVTHTAETYSGAFETFVSYCFGKDAEMAKEFIYQHREHKGQEFAALQIVLKSAIIDDIDDELDDEFYGYDLDEDNNQERLHLLFLETVEDSQMVEYTGPLGHVYKRIGTVALRKIRTKRFGSGKGEARIDEIMESALREIAEHPWPKKTVTIV